MKRLRCGQEGAGSATCVLNYEDDDSAAVQSTVTMHSDAQLSLRVGAQVKAASAEFE